MARPILQAVAAQQQQIAVLANQNEMLRHEVIVLKSQLHHMAEVAGLGQRMAAIRTRADAMNPAQPVPDPGSEGPSETTEEALAPDTMDNVQSPGMTPGSVENLGADGHDAPYNPGTSIPTEAFTDLVNVQAPIAGTETQRPLEETKTLVDVRVGDPMAPEVAFPLNPAFENQQRTSSVRIMAGVRLARLQIEAGLAAGDDLSLGEHIAASDLTDREIDREIATLSGVKKAASKQRPAGVVPRAAGVARTTPSLTSEASLSTEASAADDADDDLFL